MEAKISGIVPRKETTGIVSHMLNGKYVGKRHN